MLALTPIIATLLVALTTRRVLLALFSGVMSGVCVVILLNHDHSPDIFFSAESATDQSTVKHSNINTHHVDQRLRKAARIYESNQ